MVEAYRYAEASTLAPFPYLRLVFSAMTGMLLFGEAVRLETFLGAGLIVASALLVISERRKQAPNLVRNKPRNTPQWQKGTIDEQQ
jgi:drug/metabolite transporter (DMT)-like permease